MSEISKLSSQARETLNKMYDYLTNKLKLSKEAASAILGNAMQESTFNHNAVSSAGGMGVFQLLKDNKKRYQQFLKTGWKDGPLTQTQFTIDEILNGKDYYYDTYDRLKERQANGWKEQTADGKGWYKRVNKDGLSVDSLYFMNNYYPREQAGTMPPRRQEVVDAIKNSKDIDKITELFMRYWEKPNAGEEALDKRQSYAREIYSLFGKGGRINYLDLFQEGVVNSADNMIKATNDNKVATLATGLIYELTKPSFDTPAKSENFSTVIIDDNGIMHPQWDIKDAFKIGLLPITILSLNKRNYKS